MPKIKQSSSASMRQWILPYNKNSEVLVTDGRVVSCVLCAKDIVCKKRNHVDSHCASSTHIAALRRADRSNMKQQTLPVLTSSAMNDQVTFARDLCEVFLAANIPLWKLTNDKVKNFFEKYTSYRLPSESTIRKTQVSALFHETLRKVREKVGSHYVYITVDETTDARGDYVANLLIGTLTRSEVGSPFLIASGTLERTNGSTVSAFVNDSLIRFYEGKPFSDLILVLVTDAAPYMGVVGRNLKEIYSNLIHVTCVAHGIHRLCEKVRELFPDVNRLISSSRKIFLKCPSRCDVYKQHMGCALPPDVVITRWGTWINAAVFFATHFEQFSAVIAALPDDGSKYVANVKSVLKSRTLPSDLAFINSYLHSLPEAIKKLETRGLSLNSQLAIVEDVRSQVSRIPGSRGGILKKKCDYIFTKNAGLSILIDVNDSFLHATSPPAMSPAILSSLTYAPLVSVEVERSFSEYKAILTEKRLSLTNQNVEMHIVVQHNNKFL